MYYRIVAIGNTDTAKSTCLCTAYGSMRGGFQERKAIVWKNSVFVGQNNELERLSRSTTMTSENREYGMDLCLNGNRLFTLYWYDTVGDSIDPSNRWHRDTVENIRQADYVLAFFSCDELVKSDATTLRRTARKIELTLNTVMEANTSGLKLVICLSKSDTINQAQAQEIRSIFANMKRSVIGIPTMLYFVSTMDRHEFNSPMGPLLMVMDECLERYQMGLSKLEIRSKIRATATDHALDAWKCSYCKGVWA